MSQLRDTIGSSMYQSGTQIIPMMSLKCSQKETRIMTQREILLEMYDRLWNADKDKFTWYAIVKDALEKLETNQRCRYIKREGESCRLNNNCTYPNCNNLTINDTER